MGKHLDLDDVAAQSELAALELMQLRSYADALNLRCISDAPDAERYRWLREHGDSHCTEKDGYGGQTLRMGDRLDSAVDAAMVAALAVGAVDLWAEIHRLRAMLHEVLGFQSDPKAPTIHDFGRWRRAADGLGRDGCRQMQADDARYRRVRDSAEGYAALSACRFIGSDPTDADSAVDATMETRPVLGGA